MRVSSHQPIFLPWPGFFYKACCADIMVLLDDVQFPLGRSWMSRNRIKNEQGECWLTVPVWRKGKGKQIIRDVEICDDTDWRRTHRLGIASAYAHAPYLAEQLPAIESIYARRHARLVDFNLDLIRWLWAALGLKTRWMLQSELGVTGTGSELLAGIGRTLGADTYVTLSPVEKFLDPDTFAAHGIGLEFRRFSPPIYPQLWGDFRYNLSTLDLLLTCGPKSLDLINRCHEGRP